MSESERARALASFDALPTNIKNDINAQHPRYCYARGWEAALAALPLSAPSRDEAAPPAPADVRPMVVGGAFVKFDRPAPDDDAVGEDDVRRCEGCNGVAVTTDPEDVPLCRPCAKACDEPTHHAPDAGAAERAVRLERDDAVAQAAAARMAMSEMSVGAGLPQVVIGRTRDADGVERDWAIPPEKISGLVEAIAERVLRLTPLAAAAVESHERLRGTTALADVLARAEAAEREAASLRMSTADLRRRRDVLDRRLDGWRCRALTAERKLLADPPASP